MKAALIDANGVVQNIIVWDDTSTPPAGLTAIIIDDALVIRIGNIHQTDGTFLDPEQLPPEVAAH